MQKPLTIRTVAFNYYNHGVHSPLIEAHQLQLNYCQNIRVSIINHSYLICLNKKTKEKPDKSGTSDTKKDALSV